MTILIAIAAALLALTVLPAEAQQVKIETTRKPSEREARVCRRRCTTRRRGRPTPTSILAARGSSTIRPSSSRSRAPTRRRRQRALRALGLDGAEPADRLGGHALEGSQRLVRGGLLGDVDGPPARVVPAQPVR